MQRLLRVTLIFWLFIGTYVSIVILLVIVVTLNLTQVKLNLLIFLDHNIIDTSGRSLEILALGAFTAQAKVFFSQATKGFLGLAALARLI